MRALSILTALCLLSACEPSTTAPPSDGDAPDLDGGAASLDAGAPVRTDGGLPSSPDAAAPPPPVACSPACEGGAVCVAGTCEATVAGFGAIDAVLLGEAARFDDEILISEQPDGSWRPSRIYRWHDFLQAVHDMHERGVGDFRLWLGDEGASEEVRAAQGLVHLAAFLAQSMKETIRYDACDENNWDSTTGYAVSNACGQLGQRYEDYDCEMACARSPGAAMTAVTHAAWYGAPGPFFCAPDATLTAAGAGVGGRWDYAHDCWPYPATEAGFTPHDGPAWSRPECEVYEGQRAGRYVWDGSGGSVEGCCWWGRGVIQTTGRCNFGILNHHLGRSHLDPARFAHPAAPLYGDVDFCEDPEAICASAAHPELKWVAGLFYWMSSVQTYEADGWAYLDALRAFVDGGLVDDGFIDAASGIVNRGCHAPPCATGPVDGADERRANFDRVLQVMGLR
ncbi:MAG: hypothetical protein H6719_10010 [Sandaracinaceae bacterium]|nr:hypothetical protein [Sandaracinaceae bacterium]